MNSFVYFLLIIVSVNLSNGHGLGLLGGILHDAHEKLHEQLDKVASVVVNHGLNHHHHHGLNINIESSVQIGHETSIQGQQDPGVVVVVQEQPSNPGIPIPQPPPGDHFQHPPQPSHPGPQTGGYGNPQYPPGIPTRPEEQFHQPPRPVLPPGGYGSQMGSYGQQNHNDGSNFNKGQGYQNQEEVGNANWEQNRPTQVNKPNTGSYGNTNTNGYNNNPNVAHYSNQGDYGASTTSKPAFGGNYGTQQTDNSNYGNQKQEHTKPVSSTSGYSHDLTEKPAGDCKKPPYLSDDSKNQLNDQPLHIPLGPNEYMYGGDKNTNDPKRETDKDAELDADDDIPIDIRFKDE